ncbi:hypothetical protein FRC00_007945 [Tulasnella sp. 408]|nr:hypothetical protein FRC00_007945 [Tulasnella sp. 408]
MATVPAPPPLAIIEATFGPFVTGIMMQQLFMGVIVVQVYDYYRVFTKDSTFYKSLVAVMLAVTILQATMDFYVMSVMVTLSARTGMREIMEGNAGTTYQATRLENQGSSSGGQTGSKLNYGTAGRVLPTQSTNNANLGGIQISTTTYIRDDNDNAVDVDHDSTRKVRTNSDIELGPVSNGKEHEMHIPIQYPDGRVARTRGGKDDSGSTSDEDDWKGGRGL